MNPYYGPFIWAYLVIRMWVAAMWINEIKKPGESSLYRALLTALAMLFWLPGLVGAFAFTLLRWWAKHIFSDEHQEAPDDYGAMY
jgi:hypothetical protein